MSVEGFSIFGKIFVQGAAEAKKDLDQVNKKLDETKKKTDETGKAASNFSERMQAIGQGVHGVGASLFSGVTVPLALVGGAMTKTALDAEEMRSKFAVVYGDMSESAEAWATQYAESIGRSKVETMGYLANLGSFMAAMGATKEQAASMSQQFITLAGDIAAFNNISDTEAIDMMTSALKGEYEMLDNIGVALNAEKMNRISAAAGLGKEFGALDEVTKMKLLYTEITRQTAHMEGYAAKEAESAGGKLRTLKGDVKDLADTYGQMLVPALVWVVDKLQGVADWLGKLSPEQQKWVLALGALGVVLPPIIIAVGGLVAALGALAVAEWAVILPIAAIIAGIALIGVGIAAAIIYWDKITAAISRFTKQTAAEWHNFTTKIDLTMEAMRLKFSQKMDAIKQKAIDIAQQTARGFIRGVEDLRNGVSNTVEGVKNKFGEIWTKASDIINRVRGLFSGFSAKLNIKIPKITVSWGWKEKLGVKVPYPNFGLSWYARGGFFDSPTVAGLGEKGLEAIVPLENRKLMEPFSRAIAENLSAFHGSAARQIIEVPVYLNGKEVARAITPDIDRELQRANRLKGGK